MVQPDTGFLKDLIASGGGDLKKCFQCGACSVVCTLAPDDAPFPRKQMVAAQWGLKDRLVADPAIWLCHNCGDCTTRCPRGARPSDVLGALRRETIQHFAFPAWLGRAVATPKLLPVLFLLPALIFLFLWDRPPGLSIFSVDKAGALSHSYEFAHLFPIPTLEALFFAVSGFALLAFAVGLTRFARALGGPILAGLLPALLAILVHERFAKCSDQKARRWGHLLTLSGFLGLAVMGTVVGLATMTGLMRTPLDLTHPLKIFANLCALVILAGGLILLVSRIRQPASTYFDWLFMATLVGVIFTGIASELLRLAQLVPLMYAIYYLHLVLVFALFLYAPYSKFAHLAYRTVAMAAAHIPQPTTHNPQPGGPIEN